MDKLYQEKIVATEFVKDDELFTEKKPEYSSNKDYMYMDIPEKIVDKKNDLYREASTDDNENDLLSYRSSRPGINYKKLHLPHSSEYTIVQGLTYKLVKRFSSSDTYEDRLVHEMYYTKEGGFTSSLIELYIPSLKALKQPGHPIIANLYVDLDDMFRYVPENIFGNTMYFSHIQIIYNNEIIKESQIFPRYRLFPRSALYKTPMGVFDLYKKEIEMLKLKVKIPY